MGLRRSYNPADVLGNSQRKSVMRMLG